VTTCGGLPWVIVGVAGKSLVSVASEDQFAEFVAGALPRLLRFGYALTGDPASAEDLVQTALGRSLRAWRLRRIDNPQAFVQKVMVNSYATWYRSSHLRREVVTPEPMDSLAHDNHAEKIEDRDVIWRALSKLPPRQRAVIVLRYYEDLSEQDIAEVMAISAGTVKSQSARALRRLAEVLAPAEVTRRGD
jgi:RNA polymerase sigma-70 factor (sigma-E family)